jgi:uncharacterized protein with PIN domain
VAGVASGAKGTFAYWNQPASLGWSNYVLSATLNAADDDGIGLLFRYQNRSDYYKVELDRQQGFCKLLKVVSGAEILLASEAAGYPMGPDLALRVQADGSQIGVWLDAAPLFGGVVADDDLLRLAKASRAIVVTTDSLLLERRLVRDSHIQTLWLPSALAIGEQLVLVLQHFDLVLREPRCMHCGGELRSVAKEAVRERIPPRTRRWLDDHFEYARCDRLYWHGTHWQRIKEHWDSYGSAPDRSGRPSPSCRSDLGQEQARQVAGLARKQVCR